MKAVFFLATEGMGGAGKSMAGSLSVDREPLSKAARAPMAGGAPATKKTRKKAGVDRGYEWRRKRPAPGTGDRKSFRT